LCSKYGTTWGYLEGAIWLSSYYDKISQQAEECSKTGTGDTSSFVVRIYKNCQNEKTYNFRELLGTMAESWRYLPGDNQEGLILTRRVNE
jgi:hypothetical protein